MAGGMGWGGGGEEWRGGLREGVGEKWGGWGGKGGGEGEERREERGWGGGGFSEYMLLRCRCRPLVGGYLDVGHIFMVGDLKLLVEYPFRCIKESTGSGQPVKSCS